MRDCGYWLSEIISPTHVSRVLRAVPVGRVQNQRRRETERHTPSPLSPRAMDPLDVCARLVGCVVSGDLGEMLLRVAGDAAGAKKIISRIC